MKKRICGDCRAKDRKDFTINCSLGFNTEPIHINGIEVDCKPLEVCPKPLTYKNLFEAEKKRGKHK